MCSMPHWDTTAIPLSEQHLGQLACPSVRYRSMMPRVSTKTFRSTSRSYGDEREDKQEDWTVCACSIGHCCLCIDYRFPVPCLPWHHPEPDAREAEGRSALGLFCGAGGELSGREQDRARALFTRASRRGRD